MTTTAGNAAVGVDKEKVEKRRALGRGLESLLPGPRAVVPSNSGGAGVGHGSGGTGEKQVPHRAFGPVRNDKDEGEAVVASIQAVAEDGAAVATQAPTPSASAVPAQSVSVAAGSPSTVPASAGNLVVNLAIGEIDKNPYQTRYISDDDALEELANSIKANGVVQPIMVRPAAEAGRYVLILGERRLHASKKAGLGTIPAMVRRVSDQQAAEMTIVENLQREDLSALEQAEAFKVLSQEFKMTQTEIGVRVGLSRESVSNYMRLLKLPKSVLERLARKEFGFSEAKELLKLEDPELIEKTVDYVVKRHMSLEQIETLVMRMTGLLDPVPGMPGQVVKKSGGARWVDPNVRSAQTDLERLLGVRVRIRDRKGKGKIVIEYHTVDDYERVVEMLRGKK